MAKEKSKFNEFSEEMDVTEEQAKIGVSIIDGRRCLHGLNADQVDEMNDLSLGLDDYKKLLAERKAKSKDKSKKE